MQLNEEQAALASHTAGAEIVEGEGASKASTGKFKDVESLKKAYGSLESEFTKRCQRIKELEGELETYKKAETSPVGADDAIPEAGPSAVDKATSGDARVNAVVDFLQRFPEAVKDLDNLEKHLNKEDGYRSGDMERAYIALLKDRAESRERELTNEEYLYGLVKDTPVGERLIKEYISTVKNSAPDTVLMGGKGSIALTPPMRPKTLAEAKTLASQIIKIR